MVTATGPPGSDEERIVRYLRLPPPAGIQPRPRSDCHPIGGSGRRVALPQGWPSSRDSWRRTQRPRHPVSDLGDRHGEGTITAVGWPPPGLRTDRLILHDDSLGQRWMRGSGRPRSPFRWHGNEAARLHSNGPGNRPTPAGAVGQETEAPHMYAGKVCDDAMRESADPLRPGRRLRRPARGAGVWAVGCESSGGGMREWTAGRSEPPPWT